MKSTVNWFYIFTAISLCIGGAFFSIKCFIRYNAGPTYMATDIVSQEQATLPEFSVCVTNLEELNITKGMKFHNSIFTIVCSSKLLYKPCEVKI